MITSTRDFNKLTASKVSYSVYSIERVRMYHQISLSASILTLRYPLTHPAPLTQLEVISTEPMGRLRDSPHVIAMCCDLNTASNTPTAHTSLTEPQIYSTS